MKLVKKYESEVETFIEVCWRLARYMYVTGSGGNLAWKLADDLLLITPTQFHKGDIQASDVVFVNLKGETVEGERRPTGEMPMYLKFFAERPDIVSVVHCHPPHVCAMAIAKGKNWLMRPLYPETVTEVGPVPVVPYGEPLTDGDECRVARGERPVGDFGVAGWGDQGDRPGSGRQPGQRDEDARSAALWRAGRESVAGRYVF